MFNIKLMLFHTGSSLKPIYKCGSKIHTCSIESFPITRFHTIHSSTPRAPLLRSTRLSYPLVAAVALYGLLLHPSTRAYLLYTPPLLPNHLVCSPRAVTIFTHSALPQPSKAPLRLSTRRSCSRRRSRHTRGWSGASRSRR